MSDEEAKKILGNRNPHAPWIEPSEEEPTEPEAETKAEPEEKKGRPILKLGHFHNMTLQKK